MRTFDQTLLDRLSAEAADNPRLRKNLNIHPSDESCCHRLFNAIEPGSYIRPHRHLDKSKDETFVIIRGRLGVILFDDSGNIVEQVVLAPDATIALDIPHSVFHTAVCLAPGPSFSKAKAGPYRPLSADERHRGLPPTGHRQQPVTCSISARCSRSSPTDDALHPFHTHGSADPRSPRP